ncbi:MAG: alpha/beta hydrolase, partial [Desulfuromonas sp.]
MSRGLRLLLLALLPLLLTGCSSLLFFPDRTLRQHPTVERFHPEDRTFTSGDETLHGWFFAAEKPVASILVLHGNAENLTSHIHSTLWLVKEGFNLFIVDYRGYGQSSGSPDLAGAHNDAAAALEALNRFPESADMPLIVLGQSIGAAIAVKTVATTPFKERLAALVLDSPF